QKTERREEPDAGRAPEEGGEQVFPHRILRHRGEHRHDPIRERAPGAQPDREERTPLEQCERLPDHPRAPRRLEARMPHHGAVQMVVHVVHVEAYRGRSPAARRTSAATACRVGSGGSGSGPTPTRTAPTAPGSTTESGPLPTRVRPTKPMRGGVGPLAHRLPVTLLAVAGTLYMD